MSTKQDDDIQHELLAAKETLAFLESQQLAIQSAKKGIGTVYHPYDLTTGAATFG